MKTLTLKLMLIFFLLTSLLHAKSKYFDEGVNLYNKEKLEEAQFKFEQEIVLNPKSELSYLYLSKIFNKLDNKILEEQNLKTVMLLNPKNEEAIYYLAKLKLASSDYKKSRELYDRLSVICIKFCSKNNELKIEIENLSKK